MFHLAQSVYKHWNLRQQHDLLIIGLDGSGKTSFIESLKAYFNKPSKDLSRIQPTIGQNVSFVSVDARHIWKLIDVSGQSSFRYLWDSYLNKENIHGVIYVVDASNIDRLQDSINELKQRYKDNNDAIEIPIALVLNKCDQCPDISYFIDRFTLLFADLNISRSSIFQVGTNMPQHLRSPSEWMSVQLKENKDVIPPSYR